MRYYVIIPAHNEEKYLGNALESLLDQELLPAKIVVANDHSSDGTEVIIDRFAGNYSLVVKCNVESSPEHAAGRKVIHAFNQGLAILDNNYEFIVKMDADIVVPPSYFKKVSQLFGEDKKVGIAGGFAYERDKAGGWALEHPMNTDHVRGGFKAYSAACFKAIGGLKPAIGWDTVDELLARYHGFSIVTDKSLKVKHLRPLGASYSKKSWQLQGEALYRLRYGWTIAAIATLKMAVKHRKPRIIIDNLLGYIKAWKSGSGYLVNEDEGRFIRKYRWKGIAGKLTQY